MNGKTVLLYTVMLTVVVTIITTVSCSNSPNDTAPPITTNAATGNTVVPVTMVNFTTNRSPEQGWWTWPPPNATPEPKAAPIDSTFQINGDVLFEVDRAELVPAAASQLSGLVQLAHAHPSASIQITGYTDSDGTEAYNLDLSARRARTVADRLAHEGVDPARMQIRGLGEADPIAPNDSDEHKAANRRVVITIQSA